MKHLLLTAAAAAMVLALASCTKTKVTDVPESRNIEFEAFIWNPTKAVEEVTTDNIKAFYVFGTKTQSGDFFNNTKVYESGTENKWIYDNRFMWEESETYTFAAYSNGGTSVDGDGAKIVGAAWDGTDLTISGYNAATEPKDLLVSIASNVQDVIDNNAPVQFNFQHALSMIKFTLNSDLGDGNNAITISSFKVKGINSTANLTYSAVNGVEWANWAATADLSAADFTTETSTPVESEPFVVIPQEENISFTVTFTATFADDEEGTYSQDLTATVDNQTFAPGWRYNYVATITGADMKVITFADPIVDPWVDGEVGIEDLQN